MFKVRIYYDMKLPVTCNQSLSICMEKDLQLAKFMDQFKEQPKKKIINAFLYKYNPNNRK